MNQINSINHSLNQSINQSINPSIHPSIYLFIYLSIRPSTDNTNQPTNQSFHPSFVRAYVRPSTQSQPYSTLRSFIRHTLNCQTLGVLFNSYPLLQTQENLFAIWPADCAYIPREVQCMTASNLFCGQDATKSD